MIEDKELDAIFKEREKSIISFEKKEKEERQDIKSVSTEIVKKGVEEAVVHQLQTSEDVKERFLQTGKKVVDTNLSTIENEAEANEKAAILKNNKDACELYGIDDKTVPKWVVKCAKKVQDFCYAAWLIIGFFTTVPIVFLGKKIKVVVKRTWISMTLAALIYIILTTSSIWSKWFN